MSDPTPQQARYRRAPRIPAFLLLGAVIGALAAIIVLYLFPDDGVYSLPQVIGFAMAILVPICAALTGVIAIVLDRRAERTARLVQVEQIRTERAEQQQAGAPAAQDSTTQDGPAQDSTAQDDAGEATLS